LTRQLDHLVLPVADLAVARRRLGALGFVVAPDGRHPFGTANCCVYLADNSYLEPLAVVDPAETAAAIGAGNVFVVRDRVFRQMIGEEGASAIVVSTEDAPDDHRRFAAAGVATGEMLTFSRPFVDAAGKSDVATFRLAFAASADIADAFVFSCERMNAPKVDLSALTAHPNGASSVARIVLAPGAAAYLGLVALASESGHGEPKVGGAAVTLGDGGDCLGAATIAAIAFTVADLHIVENLLRRAAVDFRRREGQIVAPPAPGQGVAFIFEATE